MAAPVATKGFRLQRHVDALLSGAALYPADKKQRVKVATGLTMEYCLHSKDVEGATEEERVVLIQGFSQGKEAWAMAIHVLLEAWPSTTKNLKLLSFDNRGAGGSDPVFGRYTTSQMAEDTLALMDHVGWDRAHVAGISMGGMISLELAANAPKRVQSLSLLVTTRGKYVSESDNSDMRKSLLSKDPDVIVSSVLATLYPASFLSQKMEDSDQIIRDVFYNTSMSGLKKAQRKHLRGLIGQLLAIKTHFVSNERLAAIGQAGFPVVIIGAGEDKLIPTRESRTIAEHLKGDHVKLVIFEDGGHGIYAQYPDEVVQELIDTILRA